MTDQIALFDPKQYDISNLEDEIRVDRLCACLLKVFHDDLLNIQKLDPLAAGSLARGADYFLRDYMIDRHRCNIFAITGERLKGFAGNWYIVQNLEPDMTELADILSGVMAFYRFCTMRKLLNTETCLELEYHCKNHDYYQQRITAFFDIEGDGFLSWDKECPIV